jgi:hypothetical protein
VSSKFNLEAILTYITNGPVDTEFRITRFEEDRVWELIVNSDPYIPLCCGRQTGKTTLMYQLRDRLRTHDFGAVYLYLGNMSDLGPSRFYEVICEDILQQLPNCFGNNVPSAVPKNVTDQPAFVDFMEWVATKSMRCTKIVIMLDEVGGVPHGFANSFWGGLRSIFTQKGSFRRLMFVLAGELDMSALATGDNSPLANVCVTPFIDLVDFSRDQVEEVVKAGLPNRAVLVDAVYGWTSGHPYLTQKLCTVITGDIAANPARWTGQTPLDRVDELVTAYFLDREDSNLLHLQNFLNEAPVYRERVRRILSGELTRATPRNRDLAVLGIIKPGPDRVYGIRNRIYEMAMRNYLEDYPEAK